MLFSWYAADFCTDPDFADKSPEERANPSMASWGNTGYLEQQRRLLPAHKFRRLHLNLPGLPEGSAFQPTPIADAIVRGVTARVRERGVAYKAFNDMSGGSSDDAYLGIGHERDGRAVLDRLVNQGMPAPFDPSKAVARFVEVLREFGVTTVTGDKYAGETFRAQYEAAGIRYLVATKTKSQLYEALEPRLNAGSVELLDIPVLEQQLLGLVWRGGKIDHPSGEHDDAANAVAGLVDVVLGLQHLEFRMWAMGQGRDENPAEWGLWIQEEEAAREKFYRDSLVPVGPEPEEEEREVFDIEKWWRERDERKR
jgi:hypothetical protein